MTTKKTKPTLSERLENLVISIATDIKNLNDKFFNIEEKLNQLSTPKQSQYFNPAHYEEVPARNLVEIAQGVFVRGIEMRRVSFSLYDEQGNYGNELTQAVQLPLKQATDGNLNWQTNLSSHTKSFTAGKRPDDSLWKIVESQDESIELNLGVLTRLNLDPNGNQTFNLVLTHPDVNSGTPIYIELIQENNDY